MHIEIDGIEVYVIECPFCGKAKLEMVFSGTKALIYRIQCVHCFANGPVELNKFKAVSSWNKRS